MQNNPHTTLITPSAPIQTETHGGRAKCLQRLVRLEMPVPATVALSFGSVQALVRGDLPDIGAILSCFDDGCLLCVRPSSEDPDWGGPGAILNVGITPDRHRKLAARLGHAAADKIYLRFVQAYAEHVARLDPDVFDHIDEDGPLALKEALSAYEAETDDPFPEDPAAQLSGVLRSMARAWDGTTARLLRQAKGAPADAGLGLVVQEMIPGLGHGECGAGVLQLVNSETGLPQVTGRYLSQSQGRDALGEGAAAIYLKKDPRGLSLEDVLPDVFNLLKDHAARMREHLREEMQIEFVIENAHLHILDGVRVPRGARAAVRIAVRLALDGIITPEEAIMRVEPTMVNELVHRQVDPRTKRDVLASGIAASPGAASGRVVFSAAEAQALAARNEPCVLVRRETNPEDIRGMHASVAVLTQKGGMTSHAAVIGRGLGLPCIVGASDLKFQMRKKLLTAPDGREIQAGDTITIDGSTGQILLGEPKLLEAALDDSFQTLMRWADDARDIGIRANVDTPADAKMAQAFDAQGIGLCRTEHMFFEQGRLTLMREMIFAETSADRAAVLERLLPMQRDDFLQLFRIMKGLPVCIRLFDPPLHEFLPTTKAGQLELAEALDLPLSDVTRRVEAMSEYNPMLGMRGVRLGITVPEIYEMQARAIFEAAIEAGRGGEPIVPEIMIPLVSARREVEMIQAHIDAVAASVQSRRDMHVDFKLGVMVETPRAALRADEIAPHTAFLSFGTNDLTQMTYGLSRDDAGRFMSAYVRQGVFREDPFHSLDVDGVGELLRLGAERGRSARSDVVLSICGEHGGDPESIAFCREVGFDYVSVSPFRVPVVRLAAAQLALGSKI